MRRFRLLRRLGWVRAAWTFARELFLPSVMVPVGGFFLYRAFSGELTWGNVLFALVVGIVVIAVFLVNFREGLQRARDNLYTSDASSDEVAIGSDGVRWSGLFGKRVVKWSEVRRVSVASGRHLTFVVSLVNDDSLRWRVVDGRGLLDAARTALARYRERAPAPVPTELAPPERDVDAWIDRLRTLLSTASDYRAKATTPDALVRVAEDPTATPTARVASALALASAPDPLKARVRVAIDDTADPDVADLMTEALTGTLSPDRLTRVRERR